MRRRIHEGRTVGERVRSDFDEGLMTLTLVRPEAGNAMDGQCSIELREAAMRCGLREDVRAVLIRGEGRDFCFGGDLQFMGGADDVPWAIRSTVVDFHLAILQFATMTAPVVVAVNGAAAGAGLALAAVGDYVIGADNAKFAFAYDAVGLSGDGGVSWTLPRLIGMRAYKDIVFGGRRVSAEEALKIGLLSEIIAASDLDAAALAHARRLAAGPTQAYGAIKRLANQCFTSDFAGQLDLEARTVSELARSADVGNAIAALLTKKKPVFDGR